MKIIRKGILKKAKILRKATKQDNCGRGFLVVQYKGSFGQKIEEVIHKSILRK